MFFYLSNRFTNPIMFGIILKSYLSSMFWKRIHEDIIMQTRKNYCEYMYCLYTGKRKILVENIFYILKSVQNINLHTFAIFGRPKSGTLIIRGSSNKF